MPRRPPPWQGRSRPPDLGHHQRILEPLRGCSPDGVKRADLLLLTSASTMLPVLISEALPLKGRRTTVANGREGRLRRQGL